MHLATPQLETLFRIPAHRSNKSKIRINLRQLSSGDFSVILILRYFRPSLIDIGSSVVRTFDDTSRPLGESTNA